MKSEEGVISMVPRRMQRRCRSSSLNGLQRIEDAVFPMNKQLIHYANNLLSSSTYTEKFLEYAISVLPEDGIKILIEYITKKLRTEEELFSSYDRIS